MGLRREEPPLQKPPNRSTRHKTAVANPSVQKLVIKWVTRRGRSIEQLECLRAWYYKFLYLLSTASEWVITDYNLINIERDIDQRKLILETEWAVHQVHLCTRCGGLLMNSAYEKMPAEPLRNWPNGRWMMIGRDTPSSLITTRL